MFFKKKKKEQVKEEKIPKFSKEELVKFLVENYADKHCRVDLTGLDFSGYDVDVDISEMKVKHSLLQKEQTVGHSLFQGHQTVGNYLSQDYQNVGDDLYQKFCIVGGHLYQNNQQVEKDIYQDSQIVKGLIKQSNHLVKGDVVQDGHTVFSSIRNYKVGPLEQTIEETSKNFVSSNRIERVLPLDEEEKNSRFEEHKERELWERKKRGY